MDLAGRQPAGGCGRPNRKGCGDARVRCGCHTVVTPRRTSASQTFARLAPTFARLALDLPGHAVILRTAFRALAERGTPRRGRTRRPRRDGAGCGRSRAGR